MSTTRSESIDAGIAFLFNRRADYGGRLAYYDDKAITSESTYLHSDDLSLLALLFKKALGVKTYNPQVEEKGEKILYTARSFQSAFQEMSQDELTILVQRNQRFKTTLANAAALLTPEQPRVSMLISSLGMDALQSAHFININLQLMSNSISITVDDSFTPLLSVNEQKNYQRRLLKLFSALLQPRPVRLNLNNIALQQAANCGIHALINKINHEHGLQLSAEVLVKPLRKALDASYTDSDSAPLLQAVGQCLGVVGNKEQKSYSPDVPLQKKSAYQAMYLKQEKARGWKSFWAAVGGVLTSPTIILPVIIYLCWRYSKQNELIQKIEMTPNEYAALKRTRRALHAPKLLDEENNKPHKEVVRDKDPNKKAAYYLDLKQADRVRFFIGCHKKNKKTLSQEERDFLLASKVASASLKLV